MCNINALWLDLAKVSSLEDANKLLLEREEQIDRAFLETGLEVAKFLIEESKFSVAVFAIDIALQACSSTKEDVNDLHALFMGAKANIYARWGRYEEASDIYDNILDIFTEQNMIVELARTISNKATVHGKLGLYKEALNLYNIAQYFFFEQQAYADVADVDMKKAIIFTLMGNHEEALIIFDKVHSFFQEHEMPTEAARTDLNKAVACKELGLYDEALSLCHDARSYFAKNNMPEQVAIINKNEALIFTELGLYDKALDLLKQAYSYFYEQQMYADSAKIIMNMAIIRIQQERYEEALELCDRAQRYFREKLMLADAAANNINKALIHDRLGDYEKALALYDKSYIYYKEQQIHSSVAIIDINRAGIHIKLEKYMEATTLFKKALNECSTSSIQWMCNFGLGMVCENQLDFNKALDYYEQSINIIENWRGKLKHDKTKMDLLHDKQNVYAHIIKLRLIQGNIEKAFEYAERAKSRALLDIVWSEKDKIKPKPSLKTQHENFIRLEKALEELQNDEDKNTREIEACSQDLVAQAQTIAKEDIETASLLSVQTLGLGKIQSLLTEDMALVAYYYNHDIFAAFAITEDNIDYFDKIILDSVLKPNFHLLFDHVDETGKQIKAHIRQYENPELAKQNLEELYAQLISPIEKHIYDKTRLIIVPHGILNYLPFPALYDGQQYLVQKKIISVSPSASILSACRQKNPKQRQSCVAFINPMIDPAYDTLAFEDYPGNHFDGTDYLQFKRASATKANLLAHVHGKDIVHLNCHTIFNPSNGMYSSILLSNGDSQHPKADPLYTIETFNLDLVGASLVVLSSCNSAKGSYHPGDEIVSLPRGFFFAGAPSLLASLWAVDDEATQHLMNSFYRVFANKQFPMDKAEALQYAQRLVLEEYNEHPYFWAGFQLYGDWE